VRRLFKGWLLAYHDLQSALFKPLAESPRPVRYLSLLTISLIVAWFVYVPVHELLHVAGCLASGGEVTSLSLSRHYGAAALAKIFSFIEPDSGPYAGRLDGFRPSGDFGHLLTCFAPYILSIFPGVWLFRKSGRQQNPLLGGPGLVLALAPLINIPGDFFEMGTVISTRLVDLVGGGAPSRLIGTSSNSFHDLLRSDDLFRLIREIAAGPAQLYGLDSPTGMLILGLVVLAGLIIAVLGAGWVYQLGVLCSYKQRGPDCGGQ